MLPFGDRKMRMDSMNKNIRYDMPVSYARKILLDLVLADHTYAKASALDPEFNRTHLTSLLFKKAQEVADDDDLAIDVETFVESKDVLVDFDRDAGKKQMAELEEGLKALQENDNWQEEDQIIRMGWTREQARLFDQVYKILSTYRLARCSYEGHPNEQILRSLALDKASKRFRNVAGVAAWDSKLMAWLHSTVVDGINSYLFLCYLELLQSLKAKIPSLIDKMVTTAAVTSERFEVLSSPKISGFLSKAWEPTPKLKSARIKETSIGNQKEQPFIENKPLLFMLPRGPCVSLSHPKRYTFWQNQLANVGRMVKINVLDVEKPEEFAVSSYLGNIVGATRAKISLFKSQFPGKPVILIGWSVGALLSCQIATLENVAGIVCLGYPSTGIEGIREMESYNCLEVKCPVMYVIGSHSPTCSAEFIEGLREKMRVDTKLLIVEGGDEVLKLTSSQKRRMQVTQKMVDRLIMDEVESFIADVLTKNDRTKESFRPDTPTSSSQSLRTADKKRKIKRLEMDRSVIDKKKPKLSPSQQQKLQNKARPKGSSIQEASNDSVNSMKTANEAANQSLLSNPSSSPIPRSSVSDYKEHNNLKDASSNTKLTVRSPHLKYGEKAIKKPKFMKKPPQVSRSLSTPPQLSISQSDILAMQRFPTTSSILLSNSGAHVRLHDGRILKVSSADVSKLQQSAGQLSHATLNRPTSLSSRAMPGLMLASSIGGSSANAKPMIASSIQTNLFSGQGMLGFSQQAGSEMTVDSKNTASSAAVSFLGTASSTPPTLNKSMSRAFSAPSASNATQLSPNDLKYLTDLFNKGQVKSNLDTTPGNTDLIGVTKPSESPHPVYDSPISAKIGIGTLTNLAGTDGSPPGSGTRLSPGSGLKQSPQKESATVEKQSLTGQSDNVRGQSDSLKGQSDNLKGHNEVSLPANAAESTAVLAQGSPCIRKEISKGPRSTPVTITIPTYNTKGQGVTSLKVSSVVGNSIPTISASSQPIAKISHSKSAIELSQLMKMGLSSSTQTLNQPSAITSTASPATLTVTSRQLQGSSQRSMKNPQTITLHIPNSAMLKDHKNLKSSGSEIKFIGFLNQKGRSPMSSPIHFSVQSQSNPGSPKSQSPSLVLTSKSDPPSPNPIKIIADKESDSQSTAGLKQQSKLPQAPASVSLSVPKPVTSSFMVKNGNSASKISKPTSIQTALLKSLTTVPFSAKQKESIANLLKSQSIAQGHDAKLAGPDAVQKDAGDGMAVTSSVSTRSVSQNVESTKSTELNMIKPAKDSLDKEAGSIKLNSVGKVRSKTVETSNAKALRGNLSIGSIKESDRDAISFVSDNSVTTVVKNSSREIKGEVNGHGTLPGRTHEKGMAGDIVLTKPGAVGETFERDGNEDAKNTKETGAYRSQSVDIGSVMPGNENLEKKQKRSKETSSPVVETTSDEDIGSTPKKRFTRRAMSAGDGKGNLSNVQKTEE